MPGEFGKQAFDLHWGIASRENPPGLNQKHSSVAIPCLRTARQELRKKWLLMNTENTEKSSKTKRTVIVVAVVLLIFLLACTFISRSVHTSLLTRVETAPIEKAQLSYAIRADASVLFDIVTVRAESSYRILEVCVKEREFVERGDPLFRVDQSDMLQQQGQLEFQIWNIDNELAPLLKRRTRNAATRLRIESLNRQRELIVMEMDMLAMPEIIDGEFLSPFSGMVAGVNTAAGQSVASGEGVMGIITEGGPPPLVVWYLDAEQSIPFRVGSNAVFTRNFGGAEEGEQVSREVTGRVWDTEKGMYRYSFGFGDGNPALHGERVSIFMTAHAGPFNQTVPLSAVHDPDGKAYIFVVQTREGLFGSELFVRRVEIKVIETSSRAIAIEDDTLSPYARVVTSSSAPLFNGDTVWSVTLGLSEMELG